MAIVRDGRIEVGSRLIEECVYLPHRIVNGAWNDAPKRIGSQDSGDEIDRVVDQAICNWPYLISCWWPPNSAMKPLTLPSARDY